MRERKRRLLDCEPLWDFALKVLAARAHSSGELRRKLLLKASDPGDIEGVIERLRDHGYLNDRRYAESFAAARLSNEKFGRMRVIQDLRRRRVSPPVAEAAVGEVYENVNEEALIEDWVRRKYRLAEREGLFQNDKDLSGAYRRLARAGFRTGDILRVLKRFARNPELLDDFEPPQAEDEP
jgi:regulatory protein